MIPMNSKSEKSNKITFSICMSLTSYLHFLLRVIFIIFFRCHLKGLLKFAKKKFILFCHIYFLGLEGKHFISQVFHLELHVWVSFHSLLVTTVTSSRMQPEQLRVS